MTDKNDTIDNAITEIMAGEALGPVLFQLWEQADTALTDKERITKMLEEKHIHWQPMPFSYKKGNSIEIELDEDDINVDQEDRTCAKCEDCKEGNCEIAHLSFSIYINFDAVGRLIELSIEQGCK